MTSLDRLREEIHEFNTTTSRILNADPRISVTHYEIAQAISKALESIDARLRLIENSML